jgi:predicted deacylase
MGIEWRAFAEQAAGNRRLVEPGTRQRFGIRIAETVDGQPVELPVLVIGGRGDGPVLWVHSAVHGDEVNCIGAIHELIDGVEQTGLSGTLILVPVLNVAGFRNFRREAPYDDADMNRIWDKDPSTLGLTKVFSYVYVQRVLSIITAIRPDYVVDLHDGGVPRRIMSHVLYASQAKAYAPNIGALARQTGMRIVWEHEGLFFGGSTTAQMHALGIPAFVLESGGLGQMVPDDVREMTDGLRNLMRAVGMLPGRPQARDDQQIMRKGNWVRNERAGIFRPAVRLGERVRRGAVVGRVVDVLGEPMETITAPADGIVFGLRHFAVADIGEYICNIGEIDE